MACRPNNDPNELMVVSSMLTRAGLVHLLKIRAAAGNVRAQLLLKFIDEF